MRLSKLATMTLIEDENDALIFEIFHLFKVIFLADGAVEFLKGGDDEFGLIAKLRDEFARIVCAIDWAIGKGVKLFGGLNVKVFSIDHKDDFMHFWHLR